MKKMINPFLSILLAFLLFQSNLNSQTEPCDFDQTLAFEIRETPDFQFLMEQAEEKMQTMIDNNPLAIMNQTPYTIPVVFHIIHLGEDSESNIPKSRIDQALMDLRSDFLDWPALGNNVGIDFCLAQRDPDGNSQLNDNGENITGIQRVDGTGTGLYESLGMTRGFISNEVAVKSLSNWPNTDYLNIWIVHKIAGSAVGFATLPVADDTKDGIVLETIATGTPNLSKVVSHEAGHYLSLYHTFRASSSFDSCPPNDDCTIEGDLLCDTRPHPYLGELNNWFPCDETEYHLCDASTYSNNVKENHMNYTDNACRNEFTPDQVMTLRAALMTLRPTLMNSLGCLPGCTDVIAEFTPSSLIINEDDVVTEITFTNQTTNQTSNVWEVDDKTFISEDLIYDFDTRGVYDVCLTVSDGSCTNRKCIEIKVTGSDPCFGSTSECDLLINGDFSKSNFLIKEKLYSFILTSTTDKICGWSSKNLTPDLLYLNNVLSMFIQGGEELKGREAFVSSDPQEFIGGKNYKLTFNLAVASEVGLTKEQCELVVGLAPLPNEYIDYSIDETITIINPSNVLDFLVSDIDDLNIDLKQSDFETFSINIHFSETTQSHLFFQGRNTIDSATGSLNFISDISITCEEDCNPIPDFTFDPTCPNTFVGTNTGDGDIYQWEFLCDGFVANGSTVTRDFPAGTECEVCLTVSCDLESGATICKMVTIPEDIPEECMDDCQDINITANTCEQTSGQVNEYITNFTISVPAGSGPCGEQPLQSNSTTVGVNLVSYNETPNIDPSLIDITIGMLITTPPNIDLTSNSVAAGLTLCDAEGNIICFDIRVSGSECDNCLPLTLNSDAECLDDDPTDGIFTYEGFVKFNLDPSLSEYELCNSNSSQVGFNPNLEDDNGEITISYTIESTSSEFNISTLLCIEGNDNIENCIPLVINIPEPCPEPPTDCIQDWVAKPVNGACEVIDGQIKYTINMSNVQLNNNSLQSCHGNMWATIEGGGTAVVNSGNVLGTGISFSIDIFMPCDFDQDQYSYDLRVILCDDKGEMVCLLFPIILPDCDKECDDRDDDKDKPKGRSVGNIDDSILIYPNPASQNLNIYCDRGVEKQHMVNIYDPMGRVLISQSLINGENRISTQLLSSGIHFVKVSDDLGTMIRFEKVIIIK